MIEEQSPWLNEEEEKELSTKKFNRRTFNTLAAVVAGIFGIRLTANVPLEPVQNFLEENSDSLADSLITFAEKFSIEVNKHLFKMPTHIPVLLPTQDIPDYLEEKAFSSQQSIEFTPTKVPYTNQEGITKDAIAIQLELPAELTTTHSEQTITHTNSEFLLYGMHYVTTVTGKQEFCMFVQNPDSAQTVAIGYDGGLYSFTSNGEWEELATTNNTLITVQKGWPQMKKYFQKYTTTAAYHGLTTGTRFLNELGYQPPPYIDSEAGGKTPFSGKREPHAKDFANTLEEVQEYSGGRGYFLSESGAIFDLEHHRGFTSDTFNVMKQLEYHLEQGSTGKIEIAVRNSKHADNYLSHYIYEINAKDLSDETKYQIAWQIMHHVCWASEIVTQSVLNNLSKQATGYDFILKFMDKGGLYTPEDFNTNMASVVKTLQYLQQHPNFYENYELDTSNTVHGSNNDEPAIILSHQFKEQKTSNDVESKENHARRIMLEEIVDEIGIQTVPSDTRFDHHAIGANPHIWPVQETGKTQVDASRIPNFDPTEFIPKPYFNIKVKNVPASEEYIRATVAKMLTEN